MQGDSTCCFIPSECYAKHTAMLRTWPRTPFMPEPLQTAGARLPVAPPFLALCSVLSQLHGYQFQTGMDPIPVLSTTAWPPREQNSSPWGLKKVKVLQLRQKTPLSHPMWLKLSLFSAKLYLIWGRNSRAIGKQDAFLTMTCGEFWILFLNFHLTVLNLMHIGLNVKWTLSQNLKYIYRSKMRNMQLFPTSLSIKVKNLLKTECIFIFDISLSVVFQNYIVNRNLYVK